MKTSKGFAQIIYIIVIAVLLAAVAYLLRTPKQTPSPPKDIHVGEEVKFKGTVQHGGQNTCHVDGVCSIIVNGIEVIWAQGWPTEPVGFKDNSVKVGDEVEVHGKWQDKGVVTLYGNEGYYVKLESPQNLSVITYKDDKFPFEFQYPSNFADPMVKDFIAGGGKQIVFDNPKEDFHILVEPMFGGQGAVTLEEYSLLDYRYDRKDKVGERDAIVFINENGYCDGPGCSDPYIAYTFFATYENSNLNTFYSLIFYGNTQLSDTERKILESFTVN